jgi:hypothetical protein
MRPTAAAKGSGGPQRHPDGIILTRPEPEAA